MEARLPVEAFAPEIGLQESPAPIRHVNFCSNDINLSLDTEILDTRLFNTAAFSTTEIAASGWTLTAATSSSATDCSTYHLLGGYNIFKQSTLISKSWSSLSPHFRARITFFFMKIDDWGGAKLMVG